MIKVQVIEQFTFKDYDQIKDTIERININTPGKLYVGDKFECTKEIADYLLGNNHLNKAVVKILEIKPDKQSEYKKVADVPSVEKEKKPTKKSTKVAKSKH